MLEQYLYEFKKLKQYNIDKAYDYITSSILQIMREDAYNLAGLDFVELDEFLYYGTTARERCNDGSLHFNDMQEAYLKEFPEIEMEGLYYHWIHHDGADKVLAIDKFMDYINHIDYRMKTYYGFGGYNDDNGLEDLLKTHIVHNLINITNYKDKEYLADVCVRCANMMKDKLTQCDKYLDFYDDAILLYKKAEEFYEVNEDIEKCLELKKEWEEEN